MISYYIPGSCSTALHDWIGLINPIFDQNFPRVGTSKLAATNGTRKQLENNSLEHLGKDCIIFCQVIGGNFRGSESAERRFHRSDYIYNRRFSENLGSNLFFGKKGSRIPPGILIHSVIMYSYVLEGSARFSRFSASLCLNISEMLAVMVNFYWI